ncbi:MAG: hypothetical protein A2Z35_01010 [Actinobacteria bacterium RBG_19FT_COMBO_36_27]|nr:MAG: hypothetical protein A2Z35_01010 [Actinobacteria bacterium RBG_19FT_COMBO_36_27]
MKKNISRENLIIVDGHNLIFDFFKAGKLSREKIDYIKDKLIADLSLYKSQKNYDVVIVFDARNSENPKRSIQTIDDVKVIYSRRNESADAVIEELVGVETGYPDMEPAVYSRIFVVTSDYLQQKVVFRKNVYRKSCREFHIELKDLKREVREKIAGFRKESDRKFFTLEKRLSIKTRKKLSELRKKHN